MSTLQRLISIALIAVCFIFFVPVGAVLGGTALAGHDPSGRLGGETEDRPGSAGWSKGDICFGSEQTPSEPASGN